MGFILVQYLILALVDQLARFIEPNEPNRPAKYLLSQLCSRRLIADQLVQDFDSDISGVRKAFKVLISQITMDVSDHFSHSDHNALVRYNNTQPKVAPIHKDLLEVIPNIPRFELDFRVLNSLGRGGFGHVYRAHNV